MGSNYRYKHYNDDDQDKDEPDKRITDYTTQPSSHFNRADIDLILPVLKEVGKVICPPMAIPIEILYQLYTHADTIQEVATAINRGDYSGAVKAAGIQAVKDVAGTALSAGTSQSVDQAASATGVVVANAVKDEESKEVTKKVTEAVVEGGAEGLQDKIIDKTVDAIKETIEGENK